MSFLEQNANNRSGIGMTSERTRRRLIDQLRDQDISDLSVLQAIYETPRHLFVDEALASRAYENTALPIGHGQTISQPYIVALMTQCLLQKPHQRVLEIGTGCGYQTAILSRLCEQIVSIEYVIQLHRRARNLLYDLGVRNVRYVHGDGFAGYPEDAPYDVILAAAVSDDIPSTLLDQLVEEGRLIMPVTKGKQQVLIIADKINGELKKQEVEFVRFVPRLF